MRQTQEQTAKNRAAIIEAASKAFRTRGVDGTGLADLMKEAGFTHGGFYNHFASKEELAAEACRAAFEGTLSGLGSVKSQPTEALLGLLETYLSIGHRDAADGGCPTSALVVDAARQGPLLRQAFAAGTQAFIRDLTAQLIACEASADAAEARQRAIGLMSGIVGAMLLARARAGAEPELSDEILAAGRQRLAAELG